MSITVENPCNDCIRKGGLSCIPNHCLRFNLYKNSHKFFPHPNGGIDKMMFCKLRHDQNGGSKA